MSTFKWPHETRILLSMSQHGSVEDQSKGYDKSSNTRSKFQCVQMMTSF